MVDYLHVVIKIIHAEFEVIVTMETFFSKAQAAFLLKNKLDFEKMNICKHPYFHRHCAFSWLKALDFMSYGFRLAA